MIASEASWFHPGFQLFFLGSLVSLWVWRRLNFRRGLQVFSMTLFISLFLLSSLKGRPGWPVDFFIFSDPLVALVHTLAGRAFLGIMLVSLLFVALAVVMGRLYCSHICPLGTLLDISDRYLGRKQNTEENRGSYRGLRKLKFLFLLIILFAALCGFNLLGYGDPMVIFSRFAAMVFYPSAMLLGDLGLEVLKPVSTWIGRLEMAYFEIILPSFEGAFFMACLLALLILLGRLQSRFWCRHLCPLGALLGWAGKRAPYRRRVDAGCTGCDLCTRRCPAGAIHAEGIRTDRSECIVCLQCVHICPEKAVGFRFRPAEPDIDLPGVKLSRRAFIGGAVGGVAAGIGFRADILHPSRDFIPLSLRHQDLIRPPGALPEPEFLRRCTRCGLCLRACPANTLQPDWHRAGMEGVWAPYMNLRHAACDQDCNICGLVCPTKSIRPLNLTERIHARVGTAIIIKDRCLPWINHKRCLVCEEQCPYNAVTLKRREGYRFGLPVVDTHKCNGCGRCEDKCPVGGDSAIVVIPQGEIRLLKGSYVKECRSRNLVFEKKDQGRNHFRLDNSTLPFQDPDHVPPSR